MIDEGLVSSKECKVDRGSTEGGGVKSELSCGECKQTRGKS